MPNIIKNSLITLMIITVGCSGSNLETDRELSNDFKNYWFDGKAEISSFSLDQSRYGEQRDGHAVLIFVTEPFAPDRQVKLDNPDAASGINVLKLNFVRKFTTGIYPYSTMMSTFSPLTYYGKSNMLKETFSSQEWCGHVFTQLNNRDNAFMINSFSYFEKEGDENTVLPQVFTEDEIWSRIRFNPEELPVGKIELLPGMMTSRLKHIKFQPAAAEASLQQTDSLLIYHIVYSPEWELKISFDAGFPHRIQSWEEKFDGSVTTATRMKTFRLPYWNLNNNRDQIWRDSLNLQ